MSFYHQPRVTFGTNHLAFPLRSLPPAEIGMQLVVVNLFRGKQLRGSAQN